MTEHAGMNSHERKPSSASVDDMPPDTSATDPPREVEASLPNVARIYDYLLDGKDNFASDRRVADELMRLMPAVAVVAKENRHFLQRAVRFLAAEAGVGQFLDIGTGLPTRGNVHQVAQQCRPGSRVLYVDNDAVVITHARALLDDNTTAIAINGDLRDPRAILDHPRLQALFNLNEPVGVLLVAVLHFISDDENPHRLVREIMEEMPRGSYLAISHGTADHVEAGVERKARKLYDRTANGATARSRDEITRFFDGCELIDPGIANVSAWRNVFRTPESGRILCYAGVGVKR